MQRNSLIKRNALPAAIAAGLLASGQAAAQAQTGEGAENLLMEEIVVTATRRESTVTEIPYNISAISGEFIERSKILSTGELLRGVPGANVIDYGARNAGNVNTIRIRGLAVDSMRSSDT